MINVQKWRQNSPEWGKLPVGTKTVSSDGCFYVSLLSLLHVHLREDPKTFHEKAMESGLLSGDGVSWWNLGKATDYRCFLMDFVHTTNHPGRVSKMQIGEALKRIERLLSLGQGVVLHVDAIMPIGQPDHAIACFDRTRVGDKITDLTVMDPITGRISQFSERYGDIWDNLYGYRSLAYPNATYPDWATQADIKDGVCAYKAAILKKELPSSLMGVAKTYATEIYDSLIAPRV